MGVLWVWGLEALGGKLGCNHVHAKTEQHWVSRSEFLSFVSIVVAVLGVLGNSTRVAVAKHRSPHNYQFYSLGFISIFILSILIISGPYTYTSTTV